MLVTITWNYTTFCHSFVSNNRFVRYCAYIHQVKWIGPYSLCHIVKHGSLMPLAKLDGNSLTTFKVIIAKLLAYFFVFGVHQVLWPRCTSGLEAASTVFSAAFQPSEVWLYLLLLFDICLTSLFFWRLLLVICVSWRPPKKKNLCVCWCEIIYMPGALTVISQWCQSTEGIREYKGLFFL